MSDYIVLVAISVIISVCFSAIVSDAVHNISGISDQIDVEHRAVWSNMKRLSDDNDILRARITDLEREFKERKDDGR